ncbi:MAG: hypothetical protein A2W19_11135 [Spirochaetes bacterium RBG_16_49_21]|nr:MAG: hypothetical protein A2W19_11135 [Spirochaetes bacterium RBG_16_49_21]
MNLGKIKSLFIVEDEIENQKEASTDAPVENQTTPPDKEVSISEGDVNKMVGMLSKAMSEANIDGFDYLEFKDAVIALLKDGSSEESAMKSVFTTAKTMGLTRQKLLDSISTYLTIVANEKKSFTDSLKQRKQSDIVEVEAKIKEIETQLASLGKEKDKLEKNLTSSKQKLNGAEFAFNEATNIVINKIKTDEKKIKSTIAGE